MARLTDETRAKILDEFHIGKSQNQLAFEYEVSPATINKLCKGITPKYKEKVNIASAIKSEVLQESKFLSECFDKEVNTRTQHLLLFQNSALKNQQKANELLDLTDDMKDIESHARITKTNKETVLGKDPETVINNANVQQNNQPTQINIIRDI
jgi:DNA-binding XRE family transcriptional regulator